MSVKSYGAASQLSTSSGKSYYSSGSDEGHHDYLINRKSNTSDAWWSVGDILKPGITHQNAARTMAPNGEAQNWELSDSLTDLYTKENANNSPNFRAQGKFEDRNVDLTKWLDADLSHGFIRVFHSEHDASSRLFPCTVTTPAQKVCLHFGIPSNSLHIQQNGDIIRRLEPFDCPLAIQNEYLQGIGYSNQRRIQEIGADDVTAYLVKFYAGKPVSDSTYSRNQLSAYVYVRKGKLLHQWVRRRCVISGTRLLIHRDKMSKPTIVQLAKGSVEEVNIKSQSYCLKLTSTDHGERSIYLSFIEEIDYNKWIKKLKKATSKLPTKADLSNCHLEFLPETVFINEDLQVLILRHNALRDRPIEEDIYTIGWLDDLPRFTHLQSLNLADNNLMVFPLAVCRMRSLVELNLASNKLEEIPSQIADLSNLRLLHIHNNRLQTLPDVVMEMTSLSVIVLAFNRFKTVPSVLLQSKLAVYKIDSLIMAGNSVERLPIDLLSEMTHVKKIDLRLNKLQISSVEMSQFQFLQHITHLDVRDNKIEDLDIRAIRSLEYLNCERNKIKTLQINGSSLKSLFASHNKMNVLTISPKAEYIVCMDVSFNNLSVLPSWIGDCFFLVKIDVGHNQLTAIPDRLFCGAQKLKVLRVNHNKLNKLPSDVKNCIIEELHIEHNELTQLPPEIFINSNRLRYLNATKNKLTDLPAPNRNESLNKLQELFLTANSLGNQAAHKISFFGRLRVLHLANNRITQLKNSDMEKLEQLQELNISSNNLHELPEYLGRHPKLQVLRVNSNLLQEIPNFKNSSGIKVLEVGSNRLVNVNMKNLMNSQVNLLDISGNPDITVSSQEIAKAKKICMVDMRGQNRSLLDLSSIDKSTVDKIWQSGFSQTSGIRNRLSVAVINQTQFIDQDDSLFGVLDGGRNEEIAKTLSDHLPLVVEDELKKRGQHEHYLKYSMLAAHGKLKSLGQRLGAAVGVVHIRKSRDGKTPPTLHLANVGDTEVVLCRKNKPVCLSQLFTVSQNPGECQRICESDGIITEDGRVSGVTFNTRLLGCSYLYPNVIPDPHFTTTQLTEDDQLIIVANQGLWKYMSYEEAIQEILDIPDPVVAAKRLQDLAQGYGSKENIAILVVRFLLSETERLRIKTLLETQYEGQRHLLIMLQQQAAMVRAKEQRQSEAQFGKIKFDKSGHVKRKGNDKHRPAVRADVLAEDLNRNRDIKKLEAALQQRLTNDVKDKEIRYDFTNADIGDESLSDLTFDDEDILLKSRNQNIPVSTWESHLQKRLTEEVKDREMEYMFSSHDDDVDAEVAHNGSRDARNWSTTSQKQNMSRGKSEGAILDRKVTIPKPDTNIPYERSESLDTIASFEEFSKQPVIHQNIDRDAILFHQMQLARAQNSSSTSIDSTQSDPMHASAREVFRLPQRNSARSIEVLVHNPRPVRMVNNPNIQQDKISEENEIFGEYDENLEEIYARVQKQSPSLITHTELDPVTESTHPPNTEQQATKAEEEPMYSVVNKQKQYNPYRYETNVNSNSITSINDIGVLELSENGVISSPDCSLEESIQQGVFDSSSEENSANSSPTLLLRRPKCHPRENNSPLSSPETDSRIERSESEASIIITYL
ncbi:hypothetical protein SNE40_008326 [Patella caerulea]|uniref:PH domain-containing protein n=2 Tax=Patella caerulea TaxID=87958 RepID=A0AAN8QA97_PATCE